MYVVTVKSTVEISQNFVGFSENMNFNILCVYIFYITKTDMHARILTSEAFRLKASEYNDSSSNSFSEFETRLNSFVSELDPGIVVPMFSSLDSSPMSSLDSSLEPGVVELLDDDPERVKISSRLSRSRSLFEPPCGRLIPS